MSSAATITPETSSGRNNSPTFFGLPAELRIAIYEFTFFAEAQTSSSGLAPHALTRVNKQTRHESLEIYYSSVQTIEIPFYGPNNVAHVRQWLAEGYLEHFSVLPDIAFTITANLRDESRTDRARPIFHCARQIVHPALEFEREAALHVPTLSEPDPYDTAHRAAHTRCLGLTAIGTDRGNWTGKRTRRFANAIDNREVWTTRHMTIVAEEGDFEPWHVRRIGCLWLWKFGHQKRSGDDWGRAELEVLVGFFELLNHISEGKKATEEQKVTYLRDMCEY